MTEKKQPSIENQSRALSFFLFLSSLSGYPLTFFLGTAIHRRCCCQSECWKDEAAKSDEEEEEEEEKESVVVNSLCRPPMISAGSSSLQKPIGPSASVLVDASHSPLDFHGASEIC